jgi:hypothetical protein
MAEQDTVVPRAAAEPIGTLVGRPDRRQQLLLPGGHVTFGTGRSAFRHSLPSLADWIAAHSDERSQKRGS